MITTQGLIQALHNPTIDVVVLDTVDSTNIYAANLAKQTDRVTAVVARNQTAGKGTHGRAFFSKQGQGLYLSVVFFPSETAAVAHLATPAAGVAVAQALQETAGVDARIKWVNDIVIDDKKVCGILAQSKIAANGSRLDYLIVGIGVNLRIDSFPPELTPTATSLDRHCNAWDETNLCAAIIQKLCHYMERLNAREFMTQYRQLSSVIGRQIWFENGGCLVTGMATDINRDGNLVVEADGKHYIISAGEVSIKVI